MTGDHNFTSRIVLAVGITTLAIFLSLLLWYAADVLLLAFAGILLAIFLRSLSDWVSEITPLSGGWSLGVVVVGLISILTIGIWLLAPGVADQIDELQKKLPQSVRQLERHVESYEWGRKALAQVPNANELVPDKADVLARVRGVFSTTFGAIANFFIIIFIGLYVAAEPRLYSDGLIRLVPLNRRQRAREVLDEVGSTLRWWLIGKVASMIVVGVSTVVGLWLLDIPLALTLGLLAALLTFIPNVGPILSVVPAMLLALMQSPMQALYVALLYLGIQTVESYFLTPLMQKRTVSLPPALTIFTQVLFGVMVGSLGFVLATPLTAAAIVMVKMLYIQDALKDSIETDSSQKQST